MLLQEESVFGAESARPAAESDEEERLALDRSLRRHDFDAFASSHLLAFDSTSNEAG